MACQTITIRSGSGIEQPKPKTDFPLSTETMILIGAVALVIVFLLVWRK